MGLGLARARRAGMSGTSVTAAARRTAMTAMLVMLAAMTAWAQPCYNVAYIDADGNAQTAAKAALVTSTMQGLDDGLFRSSEGWLYVESSVTLVNASNNSSSDAINLILGDNATLTINGALRFPYGASLNIYCQSGGTGRLVISGNRSGGGVLHVTSSSTLTINGGTVEATNTSNTGYGFAGGTLVMNGGTATFTGGSWGYDIYANVTFNGGQLTATGVWGGIYRNTTISWKNATDRIKASKYGGTVTIADGKYMKDGSGNVYGGTLTDAQKSAIADVELQPATEAEFIAAALPQTATDTYTISDAAGWTAFCLALQDNANYNRFSGKKVMLANNITVTRMAGSSGHEFMGTFDGNKKTLTVNYSGSSYVAPFSYVDGATIQNLVVEGNISSTGSRAAGVIGETGSPGENGTATSQIINCVSSSTITGGDYTGGFSIGGNVEIEGCVFNGTINSSGDYGGGGFVGYSQSTLKIKNCLFAPKDGSSVKGTFYYNGTAGTLTNCYYTEALGTAQGKAPRSVTAADDNVDIASIDFTGEGITYDVSDITASSGGGIDYGGTTYIGDGDEVQLTLGHADPQEGYMFSHYTVTGGGTLDNEMSNSPLLTMTDADQTIGAKYTPIPTATFAYGSGGEGWTISPDDATSTGVIPGTEVTVGYSGPHKVKSVTVKRRYNTLAELKTAVTGADATTLAELRKDYAGKVICSSGHLHPAKTAVPSGCTAAAVLGYIDDSGNCYAIALEDMEDKYTWSTIVPNSSYANRNRPLPGTTWDVTAPEGASWVVATKAIYEGIFQGLGAAEKHDGYTYDATSNAFITDGVGGTKVAGEHWSTTKYNTDGYFFLRDGWGQRSMSNSYYVRPVLAF